MSTVVQRYNEKLPYGDNDDDDDGDGNASDKQCRY